MPVVVNCLLRKPKKSVFLLIVQVTLHVGQTTFDTYALLDPCSEGTFIRDDVVNQLGMMGKPTSYYLSTIKGVDPEKVSTKQVSLSISARDGSSSLEVESAIVQPGTMFKMPSRPKLEDMNDEDLYTH